MLATLVKESRARRAALAAENERRRREAIASVGAATNAAMDAINGGAATVWQNQQQLEAEARLLHQQSHLLARQGAQWAASYQNFHQALKALGDVENWAKAIEADMTFISSSLDGLQQQREQRLQRERARVAEAAAAMQAGEAAGDGAGAPLLSSDHRNIL